MKLMGAILITIVLLSGAWFYLDPDSSKLMIPLLIAGGLASVVQSLVENKNTIVLPGPGTANTYQLGFVGDILIGMVGAFASLIVGLAVLNDNFFQDPPASVSGTSKALSGLVLLIPTWIRIASYGALTGYASRRLLPSLGNKIADMVTGAVQSEVQNQTQNLVENARSQTELVGMLAGAIRKTPNQAPAVGAFAEARVADSREVTESPVAHLAPLVDQYMAISVGDDYQRVQRKCQLADEMLATALQFGVTADQILSRISPTAADRDGWLVALASLIAVAPRSGDGARLLGIATHATQDFARYRILLALYSLKAQRQLSSTESAQAEPFIRSCLHTDDLSLQRKAKALLDFIKRTG
jgi:hypothetical protein